MRRPYIVLTAIIAVGISAVIATLPEIMAAWPERKAVQETFSRYAEALVQQRFEDAYRYQSREFRERVTLESFLKYQHDVQDKFGLLKTVEQQGITVEKWKNQDRWRASVNANFRFERATAKFTFELHRDDGRWTIFSFTGTEI